ncbi:hypothetical protein CC80DRAFT_506114 [Byssothecium circinans]|uniref:Uncharacterized protein n=1 Tax=Byssothecium circinans TaxID=147558 RepID=A0A6A5TQF6_9PLEO|nr:hypothetical protein CC80DRAFT_506114 [Byssothecium circinans]
MAEYNIERILKYAEKKYAYLFCTTCVPTCQHSFEVDVESNPGDGAEEMYRTVLKAMNTTDGSTRELQQSNWCDSEIDAYGDLERRLEEMAVRSGLQGLAGGMSQKQYNRRSENLCLAEAIKKICGEDSSVEINTTDEEEDQLDELGSSFHNVLQKVKSNLVLTHELLKNHGPSEAQYKKDAIFRPLHHLGGTKISIRFEIRDIAGAATAKPLYTVRTQQFETPLKAFMDLESLLKWKCKIDELSRKSVFSKDGEAIPDQASAPSERPDKHAS